MSTTVGLLHLDVMIGDAMSLKDKRRIVKSFKDRLSHRANVSVAEVDHQDDIRRGTLAVAMVGSDGRYVAGALEKIVASARDFRGWTMLDYELEMI
jgi:hypothetical protein